MVLLEGKKPITDIDGRFVSEVLYRIKGIGFPNLVKIENSKIYDVSIKKELYKAHNQGRSMQSVVDLINERFEVLGIPASKQLLNREGEAEEES